MTVMDETHFEVYREHLSLDYLSTLVKDDDLEGIYQGISYEPNHSTLDDFLTFTRELMELEQEDKKHKVILVDDFSKSNTFEDPRNPGTSAFAVVTCSVKKSVPGAFHQTNAPASSGGTREIRPSLRGIEKLSVDDKSVYNFYFGQKFDNIICFNIHARSNKEANEVVSWFQNLLAIHKKFFAQKGIIRYYFLERESDSVVKESDGVIHVRPVCYYLTTEEVYTVSEHVLQKIKLKLKTT
jgi:hypothetical protein